jgi:hypothetical protein
MGRKTGNAGFEMRDRGISSDQPTGKLFSV